MSIETAEELTALRACGQVVAEAIREMRAAVRPGVTTQQLDDIAAAVFARHGARSGPQLDYDFPGVTCISVDDEAVHGIPGPRELVDGELVKLDVTAELNGFYTDACLSVPVGLFDEDAMHLAATARRAFKQALQVARVGMPVNGIGAVVERVVTEAGYNVCRPLMGHGIGRRIHEDPEVPNFFVPELSQPLTEGTVLTIEPIIAAGSGEVYEDEDGWTVVTSDGSLSAHHEHTLVITADEPLLLTA